jgi:hypothetical protein
MLLALGYFISSPLDLSDESVVRVQEVLRISSSSPVVPGITSEVLDHQVKFCMHKLSQEISLSVLDELEKQLKTRSKGVWGQCFCAILVLCLHMELVQAVAVASEVSSMENDGLALPFNLERSLETCRKLDEYPFRHMVELFHGVYRTQKYDGFNPLRTDSTASEDGVLDRETKDMIEQIRLIVLNSGDSPNETRSREPSANKNRTRNGRTV